MKKTILILLLCGCAIPRPSMCADATVRLSNYESQMPVYYQQTGTLAWRDFFGTGIFVEVWGGPVGGSLRPISIIGTETTVIPLKEPGFFDAGVGVIPGVGPGGQVELKVYAWTAAVPGDRFGLNSSGSWLQSSGSWDPQSGLAPTGPPLALPSSVIVNPTIPEPYSLTLGLLGGATLLTNKVIKTMQINSHKPKNALPQSAAILPKK